MPAEKSIMRIHPLRLTLLLAALLGATPATSQTWPSRPVTMIVPYAAGGSVDVVARVVANKLGERLGQTVVIENVAGAGGVIGTQRAARAEPDGYTLLFSVESTMVIAKLVQPTVVQYDSLKDFLPISLIGAAPLVLAGHKELPANNIAELMELLKAKPGQIQLRQLRCRHLASSGRRDDQHRRQGANGACALSGRARRWSPT